LSVRAIARWQPSHPEYKIANVLATDYTPSNVESTTQTYLQAHPQTTVIMSAFGPDGTRPIVGALKLAGLSGKIKVVDIGASVYTIGQIRQGNVLMTMPYFPLEEGVYAVQEFVNAAEGKTVPEAIDDGLKYGGLQHEPVIAKKNVSSWKAEYGS
jgi:ribose transport system substrate-binding protein